MHVSDSILSCLTPRVLPAITIMAVIGCAVLAACHADTKSDGAADHARERSAPAVPAASREALNGRWLLVALGERAMPTKLPVSLIVSADNTVGGRGPVNSYNASLQSSGVDDGKFVLTPIASTLMAGSPELMDLERDYFAALAQASAWRVEGSSLILSDGSKELARFQRSPE